MKFLKASHTIALAAALTAIAASPVAGAADLRGASFKATSDSTVLQMGSQTHLQLQLSAPQATFDSLRVVGLPDKDSEYHDLDIIDLQKTEETLADGTTKRATYDILVQAFEPKLVTLPPFTAVYGTSNDTLFSNVVTLKVLEMPVDSLQEINPMHGTVELESRWYDIFPDWTLWAVLAVLGAGLLWLALWLILNRKTEKVSVKKKIVIPPYELAMKRLGDLQNSKLIDSGADKEYYTELTDILRQYLEGRFSIYALEMTSSEITKALRQNQETRLSADEIHSVLEIADFVKFAKVRPLPADNVRSFNTALKFVNDTKPVPQNENRPSEKSSENND